MFCPEGFTIVAQVATNIGDKVAPSRRNSLTADDLTDILLVRIRKNIRERSVQDKFIRAYDLYLVSALRSHTKSNALLITHICLIY